MTMSWIASMVVGVLLSLLVAVSFISYMLWRYGNLMIAERRKFSVVTFAAQIIIIAFLLAIITNLTYKEYASVSISQWLAALF